MLRQNLTNWDFLMRCRPFNNIEQQLSLKTLIYQPESYQVINQKRRKHSPRIVPEAVIVGLLQVNPCQADHQESQPAKKYVHEEIHGNRTY